MIINGIPVKHKQTIKDYRIIYYEADETSDIEEEGQKFAKFILDKCPPEFYNGLISQIKGE